MLGCTFGDSVAVSIAVLVISALSVVTGFIQVNGAGASFPEAVYHSWIPLYTASRQPANLNLTYESVGSGDGKLRIKGQKTPLVHYAGSDSLLTESDYVEHPDLQMFPTMAGAVVLSFNLPGITTLNFSRAHVVGVYDGTLSQWNDSSLQSMNPNVVLPDKSIIPIARAEKSGTTEIFTSALSSFDANWEQGPGTFSQGLGDDDVPLYWNKSVVKTFGVSTRGMTGMIMSLKYSIGYMSVADASSVQIPEVMIQNAAGGIVGATQTNVRNVMEDSAALLSTRLTASLVNGRGSVSYPIVGYTYLIMHMTNMTNCASAVELARYILWFSQDKVARRACVDKNMFPLPDSVVEIVVEKVIKRMTCRDLNVYQLLLNQLESEKDTSVNLTPLYIGTSILCVVIVLIIVFIRERIIRNKAILRSEWKIPASVFSRQKELTKLAQKSFSSINRVGPTMSPLKSEKSILSSISSASVKWKGYNVTTGKFSIDKSLLSIKKKEVVLSLRDIIHDNVLRFYGLCASDDKYYSVVDSCDRGCIYTLLHDNRYQMNNEFKYCICQEIARGIQYLHDRNIIHGNLTGKSCYLYHNWNVRVGDWEVHTIQKKKSKKLRLIQTNSEWLSLETIEKIRTKYWTAPEVFLSGGQYIKSSDIYSFAIVMQEIFSRHLPYEELYSSHSPIEIVKKAVNFELRPEFSHDTPELARDLMALAWEYDPSARPDIETLLQNIVSASRSEKSVMDCVFQTMESYVVRLEKAQLQFLEKLVPRHIARTISEKPATLIEDYPSATVLVFRLDNLDDLSLSTNISETVRFLNNIYTTIDNIRPKSRVSNAETFFGYDTFASGLTQQSSTHVYDMILFSFQVKKKMADLSAPNGKTNSISMGIATGFVSGGFLKEPIPRYYVFGEPVRDATTLCVQGDSDTILLTEVSKSALTEYPSIDVNDVCVLGGKTIYKVNLCENVDADRKEDAVPTTSEQAVASVHLESQDIVKVIEIDAS